MLFSCKRERLSQSLRPLFCYHYYPLEHCSNFHSPLTLHTGTVNTANSPPAPLAGFEQLGGSINSYDGLRNLGYENMKPRVKARPRVHLPIQPGGSQPGLEVGRPIARQPEAEEEGVARAEARRVLVASVLSLEN